MSDTLNVETRRECRLSFIGVDGDQRATTCSTMEAAIQLGDFIAGEPLAWVQAVVDGKSVWTATHNGKPFTREYID